EQHVSEDVECRSSLAVRPSARAEKCESGVDLAGHQEENEDRSEAAAAEAPLLEAHRPAPAGQQPERDCESEDRRDDDERRVHESRLLSNAKVTAMMVAVRRIHAII